MSETPRLRSAFPTTPRTDHQSQNSRPARSGYSTSNSPQPKPSPRTRPVQNTSTSQIRKDGPLISLDVIDAPTQRFYVASFYTGLLAWRLYNSWNVTDDLDSTWLFLKWLGLDAAFFVALPAFRIPWLEWSFATTITIWLLHAIANAFLMYKIPIPILGWLGAVVKVAYDRELAISEHRVKPADILHNSSVILGKQIIQILPEGSAILNPEKRAFCLDSTRLTSVELPILINQTTPISIELTRQDVDTDEIETIIISGKQAKNLKKEADRGHQKSDTNTPRLLQYQVTKRGVYRLSRVIDESKLEVRKRSYEVAVVACPQASVSVDVSNKCTGDLSGISLHVEGVPPFKVKYSKRINHQRASSITQNVQPSDFDQDQADDGSSRVVMDPRNPHKGLTQSRSVSVQINESLTQNGTWSYHVEEVEDGLGNKVMFDTDNVKKNIEAHEQSIIVHKRPIVQMSGPDVQQPLKLPEGETMDMPVQVKSASQIPEQDWPLTLTYTFAPDGATESITVEEQSFELNKGKASPRISRPGKYHLKTIQSQFCQGEVQEPSSCALYNPPEPDITVGHENLFDKCAGNPIGMIVNVDFTGTPPFKIRYTKTHRGAAHSTSKTFDSMRGQLDFFEHSAGSYIYQILEIQDSVYHAPVALKSRDLVFTQDIKPSASATFQHKNSQIKVCLGQPVSIPVRLQGEGPWDLEYEVLHGGKRKKHSIHSEHDSLDINLPELNDGGRHTVMLTAVQDKSKCRATLSEEYHIEVRAERPTAAFGDIDGQRLVKTLEGTPVEIPVRLQGVGPWTVQIRNVDHHSQPRSHVLQKRNSAISERDAGTYELLSVHDSCSGMVDTKANKFSVSWIERPALRVKDSSVVPDGALAWRKPPVCQGYEDSLNLVLSGNPPYRLRYSQKSEPINEKPAVSDKRFPVASSNAMIKLETSKAGEYTYTFLELADSRYDFSKKHFDTMIVKQQVYALPSARFANNGKVYGYCKDDPALSSDDAETIPITLTGSPPFSIEVSIAHHGSTQRPEIKRISEIHSNTFSWSLARSTFDLGTHILQIRSVKDSRGCESIVDSNPSSVRIQVSSPPTINSLESTADYCVGDHVSFSLSGQAPFDVFYNFQGRERKAHVTSHEFRRIAEQPGDMIITGVSDAAMGGGGKCRASKNIPKVIHPYPSVRIERGETKIDDIHEGGEVDIHFEFTGTPPFEFTYTRSENLNSYKKSKAKSRKPQILETRHDTSAEFHKTIRASEEGTYEVVAIKDRYCSYSVATGAGKGNRGGIGSQKLLKE